MTAYRRNLMVGAVMLVGLTALGWMVLKFGGGPATWFTAPKMEVTFIADRADGLADGSTIYYHGVPVGRITSTRLGDDKRPVIIEGLLNREPPLPSNVLGLIKTNSLLGSGASIDLQPTGPEPAPPIHEHLVIKTKYLGNALLPPEIGDLANELRALAVDLRKADLVTHLKDTIVKTGTLADSLNTFVTDPKLRNNIDQTLDNLRLASANAQSITVKLDKFSDNLTDLSADASTTIKSANTAINKASQNVDDLSKQVNDRMAQVADLLKTFNTIATKIDQGKGTAGLLINDPKLYDSLVDTAKQINSTVADVQRLVNQWEGEGMYLKFSK